VYSRGIQTVPQVIGLQSNGCEPLGKQGARGAKPLMEQVLAGRTGGPSYCDASRASPM
jgi:hypothetical protein